MTLIEVKYTMKNYKVTFSYEIEVEAEDDDLAEDKAYERFSEYLCYKVIRANEFDVDIEGIE